MSGIRRPVNQQISSIYLNNAALILFALGLIVLLVESPNVMNTSDGLAFSRLYESTADFAKEIAFAFLIAALLIFTTEKRSRGELEGMLASNIERTEKILLDGLADIGKAVEISHFLSSIDRATDDAVIEQTARVVYQRYIKGLAATEHGFALHDVDWAMDSNEVFYKVLLDQGVKDKEVRITHTTDVSMWADDFTPDSTLMMQRRLVTDHGFHIRRIFVGSETTPLDANSKFIVAMDKMRQHKIETGYVHHINPASVTDMTWLPDMHLVVTWRPQHSGRVAAIEVRPDTSLVDSLRTSWEFVTDRAVAQ